MDIKLKYRAWVGEKHTDISSPLTNSDIETFAIDFAEWLVKNCFIPDVSGSCYCGVKYTETKKSDIPYDTDNNVYYTDIMIYHCPKCGNIDRIDEY